MQQDDTDEPAAYTDDTRAIKFLLHTVKGISAVSGGVLGEALEQEYAQAEEEYKGDIPYDELP